MTRNIWLISDTHFNHSNILNFKDKNENLIRKFSDVHDMNETMIDRWNKLVKPQDKVYHLGDVYFGDEKQASFLLSRLNGHKRLVVGNHDNLKAPILHKYFEKIVLWRKLSDNGLLLTHVPVHESTLGEGRFKGKQIINVHGHTHQNGSPKGPYKSVCVELTDYTPMNIEEINE